MENSPTSRRITHVIGGLVAGGAERFVVSLVSEFRACGKDASLLVLSNRTDAAGQEMRRRLEQLGVNVRIGPTRRVGFRTVFWYRQAVVAEKPAILHLHTSNTVLVHQLSRLKVGRDFHRLFRTIHNTALPSSQLKVTALKSLQATLIACSTASAMAYKEQLNKDSTICPNGVEFDPRIRTAEISKSFKKVLGLSDGKFHFLHVGRMAGDSLNRIQKAQDVLIRAWRSSGLGEQGAEMHFLGDGPIRGQLMGLAENDPSIRFHGVVSNVNEWLLACDCFVMPSRWEGLPIAGIEAVGAGIPLLFSDIEPLRELDPPVVLWSPVDNTDELGNALCRIRSGSYFPDVEAIKLWRKSYGIEETARKYAELYCKEGSVK